jgi:ankyrin repeat protein
MNAERTQKNSGQIDAQDSDLGYTALHMAAWAGADAMVRELLLRGAKPNLLDHVSEGLSLV